ncbi:MAG: FAD-binding oxidoreductase [Gammaproteobacteria bacterium]|nr:FAD-binding oxidoreductase [Gammaproteobacteria bacterium]
MLRQTDVLIVGGGVIGSAVAYFLAASAEFGGRVVVIEAEPGYRECSTARSVGGIRQQFSTPENIEMSRFGAAFVKGAAQALGIDGEAPALAFTEAGYLFLASGEAGLGVMQANHATQRAHGASVALLAPADLAARFPWLATADLAAGSLGLADEGWLDPYALLQGFRRKARSLGAQYLHDRVVDLATDGRRVTGARLERSGAIAAGVVVNAAGTRAREVAAMAGVELPVFPRKRQVFVFACREQLADCPLVIDPSGMYFRPESGNYICGISPEAGADPDCRDFDIDYEIFEDRLWPLLAARVPAFEAIKLVNAWAGHYAYNTLDQNAILGPHPEVEGLLFANGFSGHGLQQSPAVGRALAELVVHGEYRTLDLTRFGCARLLENTPLRELNVV